MKKVDARFSFLLLLQMDHMDQNNIVLFAYNRRYKHIIFSNEAHYLDDYWILNLDQTYFKQTSENIISLENIEAGGYETSRK